MLSSMPRLDQSGNHWVVENMLVKVKEPVTQEWWIVVSRMPLEWLIGIEDLQSLSPMVVD